MRWRNSVLTDEHGHVTALLCAGEDITARARAQQELAEQERFLRSVIDSLNTPLLVIDPTTLTVVMANSAATDGKALAGGTRCYDLNHQRSTPCRGLEVPCPVQKVVETGKPVTVEHVHHNAQGDPVHVEIHACPVCDEHGQVTQIIQYSLDITDRKRAAAAMADSERRYRSLAQAAPVGILRIGASGRCDYVNQRFCDMTGMGEDQILGDAWGDGVHEQDRQRVMTQWKQAAAKGERFACEFRLAGG